MPYDFKIISEGTKKEFQREVNYWGQRGYSMLWDTFRVIPSPDNLKYQHIVIMNKQIGGKTNASI